jgi:NADH-quinone oxidoreductase subunit N
LVLLTYLLFLCDGLIHWQGTVLFLDGVLSINIPVLFGEFILISLTFLIILLTLYTLAKAELYLIFITNVLGFTFLWQSQDWIVTVIAWELFNLSLYLLVSINSNTEASLSASIKYFLLSALSTSFLLLGVALLYGLTGSTNYDIIHALLSFPLDNTNHSLSSFSLFNSFISSIGSSSFLYLLPVTLIVLTFLFKLGAAPFYNWSPDLYDSIPTPITLWMTTVVKFSLLFFLIQPSLFLFTRNAHSLFLLSGLFSLIVGSLGLGAQWRIKRFLAYSAISHLGFILLA